MLRKGARQLLRKFAVSASLIVLIILAAVGQGYATLLIQRPITDTGGVINQSYLWAEDGHKGVDFSYGLGTNVYAVANGTVVDLRENLPDGDASTAWGNFVLIQHHDLERQYDRTTDQVGYVYSMYLHLRQNSVRVAVGDSLSAGDWIAEVDDTGMFSSGNHLHLQIVNHPLPNRTLEPPPSTLDSENRSRNPELWLAPFNYGGDQTGTVIGKVSDTNGNPVANLRIYGIEKPIAADGNVYEWSQTYSYDWANPDDILVENFATTDAAPGFYHIVAKHYSGGQWVEFRDLGWHKVEAGKATYVGLYPVYLPDVKVNHNGWTSTIVIRNNRATRSAKVNTTFFNFTNWPHGQRTDILAPGDVVSFSPPDPCGGGFSGSAIVVASEDVAVVAENQYSNSRAYAYNGVAAADGLNPGWGPVGTTLYAPVIMRDYWDWYSQLTLLNTGPAPTTVQVTYYRSGDGQSHTDSHYLPANGSLTTNHSGAAANTLYAARITASQPLAATVRQYRGGVNETYNGFSAGATTAYAPLIMNDYYGWDTSVNVQNLSASTASITVQYYDAAGQPAGTAHNDTLPSYASRSYYSPAQGLPEGFIGSARVTSSNQKPIAVVVNQSAPHGGSPRRGKSYSGSLSGSVWVVIPDLANHAGSEDWVSSVNVRNLGTTSTVATLTFAGQAVNSPTLPPNGFHSFYVPNHWGTTSLRGPATVSSSGGQPLAVVVNHSAYGQTQVDLEHSYNGANR